MRTAWGLREDNSSRVGIHIVVGVAHILDSLVVDTMAHNMGLVDFGVGGHILDWGVGDMLVHNMGLVDIHLEGMVARNWDCVDSSSLE